MRKLIYAINVTLDGCCDHTKGVGSDEMLEHYTQLLRQVDLLVYGRKTYQLMVPYWPEVAKNPSETKASIEFARTFESINKIVFSRSLDGAEGGNTRIVRGNLHDEILELKQKMAKTLWPAAWIFLHNLSSLVWWMNFVLSFCQSLREKEDACWTVLDCRKDCN